jgi:hypothetical protein
MVSKTCDKSNTTPQVRDTYFDGKIQAFQKIEMHLLSIEQTDWSSQPKKKTEGKNK